MSKKLKAQLLVGTIRQGMTDVKILGFVTWWNLRSVDIDQDTFARYLKECNISEKWAREHNYRSAFTRALRNLEEKRIIRKIEETSNMMSFQFTGEELKGAGDNKRLEYDPETILVLDKGIYFKTKKFEEALVKGDKEIKSKVCEFFYREKVRYNSSDMTRYLQNILDDEAQIVSLRPQGSVYFVPVGYEAVLQNVIALVNRLEGGSVMENIPVPDVASSRSVVGSAFAAEVEQFAIVLEKEVEAVEQGEKERSDKWADTKLGKIQEMLERISSFSNVLEESRSKELRDSFTALEERIAPARKLDLSDVASDEPEKAEPVAKKADGAAA